MNYVWLAAVFDRDVGNVILGVFETAEAARSALDAQYPPATSSVGGRWTEWSKYTDVNGEAVEYLRYHSGTPLTVRRRPWNTLSKD